MGIVTKIYHNKTPCNNIQDNNHNNVAKTKVVVSIIVIVLTTNILIIAVRFLCKGLWIKHHH